MVIIITLHDTQLRVYGNHLPQDDQFEVLAVHSESGDDLTLLLDGFADRAAVFIPRHQRESASLWTTISDAALATYKAEKAQLLGRAA